jgi:hypothetical protein
MTDSSVNKHGSVIPEGARTSDYYRVNNIPDRFEHPGTEMDFKVVIYFLAYSTSATIDPITDAIFEVNKLLTQ